LRQNLPPINLNNNNLPFLDNKGIFGMGNLPANLNRQILNFNPNLTNNQMINYPNLQQGRKIQKEENYENFTQEYYKERYRNFIQSNPITPADFNENIKRFFEENIALDENSSNSNISYLNNDLNNLKFSRFSNAVSPNISSIPNIPNSQICSIIQTTLSSEFFENKLKKLTIFNWVKIFMELNTNNKINLETFLESFNSFLKFFKDKDPNSNLNNNISNSSPLSNISKFGV
jgi:hypothetical protein